MAKLIIDECRHAPFSLISPLLPTLSHVTPFACLLLLALKFFACSFLFVADDCSCLCVHVSVRACVCVCEVVCVMKLSSMITQRDDMQVHSASSAHISGSKFVLPCHKVVHCGWPRNCNLITAVVEPEHVCRKWECACVCV